MQNFGLILSCILVAGLLSFSNGDCLVIILPLEYSVECNYPNPFNANTIISNQMPVSGRVKLDVFNILGQRVATLLNGYNEAGYHKVTWDASDYSSGIYFYKLSVSDRVFTKRMTLLK